MAANQQRVRITFYLFTIFCLIFAFTGCGRERNRDGDTVEAGRDTANVGYLPTQTFSIAAPEAHVAFIWEATELLWAEFIEKGINLDINFVTFTRYDVAEHMFMQYSSLTEGNGADVFLATRQHPMYAFIESGLLADINGLIDRHAYRGDFFCNVLDAFEINDRLYTFPIEFVLEYIGINANLPESIIQRFASYDSITFTQAAGIFNYLQANYHEYNHLAFGFRAEYAAREAIHDILDSRFNWRTGRFSMMPNQLVPYINTIRTALYDNGRHGTTLPMEMFTNPMSAEMLEIQSRRYAFTFARMNPTLDTANALLEFADPHFIHYIPLAGESGGLLAPGATAFLYSVSVTADEAVAMAFLRQLTLIIPESHYSDSSLYTPIIRSAFNPENAFRRAILEPTTQRVLNRQDDIENAVSRLEAYLSKPIAIPAALFMLPAEVYSSVAHVALSTDSEPSEAAMEIWNMLNEWMGIGSNFEADPEWLAQIALMEARADLPVRTLRIMAPQELQRQLNQAAMTMNGDWANRGVEYRFNLEVSPYNVHEREEMAPRIATMMMAGMPYDMFTIYDDIPLWNWARTGLITDIWGLIDGNPLTDRTDFYTNVLEAFEHDGGLWAFPVSFGLQYIGISRRLPQYIIDNFAELDTISVRDAMDMHNYLLTSHNNDFGHMLFSKGARTEMWDEVLMHEIGSFINFDTRTSYLTDNGFISFISLLQAAFPILDYESMPDGGFVAHQQRLYNISHIYAFNVVDAWLTTQALIPMEDPSFIHHIPLTDDTGRLRIRHGERLYYGWEGLGTWMTLVYPSSGEGELAWEFTQHLIYSLVHTPSAHDIVFSGFLMSGEESPVTPILRELFESHMTRSLTRSILSSEATLAIFGEQYRIFPAHISNPVYKEQVVESAIERVSVYNEKPVVLKPFFPAGLRDGLIEIAEQFMRGLITVEAAAQSMHNRVSLWLIE